jgi:asparagine synthase (glutamine-hydrolysing)
MFQFAAFEWNPNSSKDAQAVGAFESRLTDAAKPWTVVLDAPGLKVMCATSAQSASCVHRLPNGGGVILGVIFDRPGSGSAFQPMSRLEQDESAGAEIISTGGRRLVEHYWGSYIAFIVSRDRLTHLALNSPAGHLPCFYGLRTGIRVYCSDLGDFYRLDAGALEVDWQYIAMHLVVPRHTQSTAVRGVTELRPGTCLEVAAEGTRLVRYSTATRYTADTRIYDPEVAADELRNTCRASVHAWASCYDTILLNLSGGLDSSIVAGYLRDSPSRPNVVAVNYHAKGAEADERSFARQTADYCCFKLIECERVVSKSLRTLFELPLTARPGSYVMSVDHTASERSLARELGAASIFSGHGGDEVFFAGAAEYSPADFLYERGFARQIFDIIASSARAQNLTTWRVLRSAFSRGVFTTKWSPTSLSLLRRHRQLLNPDLISQFARSQWDFYTWPPSSRGAPPGVLQQRFLLEEPIDFHGPLSTWDSPEQVSPLMSQPLLDLAARIPSYVFSRDGGDRELARSAFSGCVAPGILRRATKGCAEDWLESMFLADREYFRERIMDGYLLRRGLLNRRNVENVLSGGFATRVESFSELFHIVEVEAWLQNSVRTGSVRAPRQSVSWAQLPAINVNA